MRDCGGKGEELGGALVVNLGFGYPIDIAFQ